MVSVGLLFLALLRGQFSDVHMHRFTTQTRAFMLTVNTELVNKWRKQRQGKSVRDIVCENYYSFHQQVR